VYLGQLSLDTVLQALQALQVYNTAALCIRDNARYLLELFMRWCSVPCSRRKHKFVCCRPAEKKQYRKGTLRGRILIRTKNIVQPPSELACPSEGMYSI
jgi:hypothetical protein